ncbi:hypothetical protein TNCV_3198711 [Trichonephila clavipes]|nr:hypothetical protein TNCV_3198711 [Trichonephila clavipes]
MGENITNYDGEISAVCEATTQLLDSVLSSAKVVFFIFSEAALSAFIRNILLLSGLAADYACPHIGYTRMDDDHPLQCTEHDEYPTEDIVSRYWEARHHMFKRPSMALDK